MSERQISMASLPKSDVDDTRIIQLLQLMDGTESVSIEDRTSVLGALSRRASASNEESAQRLLTRLEQAQSGSPSAVIARELFLAHLALRKEEYELARGHASTGRDLAIRAGREAEAASFCIVAGSIDYRSAKYDSARRQLEEAVVAARRAGSRDLESRALMNLGLVLKNSGDLRGAERLIRTSLQYSSGATPEADAFRAQLNLANVLLRRGSLVKAADLAAGCAQHFEGGALFGFENSARLIQARAIRLLGDPADAQAILGRALEQARDLNRPRNVILGLEFLADCEIDLGDADAAREHYREALLLARGHGRATDLVLECLRGLGAAELACGEAQNARASVEESITIAREQGDLFELATSLLVLADTMLALDNRSAALAALEESYSLSLEIGAQHVVKESAGRIDNLRTMEIGTTTSPQALASTRKVTSAQPAAHGIPGFLTADSRLLRTLGTIRKLAPRRLNILIHGESGTGKELIAQAVHSQSGRRGPFVPVNCSAFPGDLIEGELFGHARGAYTGADRERVGLFEHANKGTLFLDEIGDMPVKAQARLLRALESGEVRRLGENSARVVDVRIVAATHRDLMTMVGAGEFRLDLYYRLAGFVAELPPVRERAEDAKLLVDHYFAKFSREQGKTLTLAADLRQQLAAHSWPGNVREIRLVMDRLVSLSEDGAEIRRLSFALEGDPRPRSLPELLEAEEKRRILDALQAHNWNKQRAAATLGTNRTTLLGKMKRMGIAARKP